MSGIFGTQAAMITDINLIIQIIAFILILVGYVYKTKGKFKNHGLVMGTAVVVHLLSFLLAMAPSLFAEWDFFTTSTSQVGVQTLWVHLVTGSVALILGAGIVIAWIVRISDITACTGRKRWMDTTVILWSISLIFGTATYLIFYL